MQQIITEYYRLISSIFNGLALPIRDLAEAINLPLVSVVLFGILGATAPCQLSASAALLAFLSRGMTDARRFWSQVLAFVAGKLTVYLLLGGIVVLLSLQLDQISETVVPVVTTARRLMGPLLVIIGLFMLGILSMRFSLGDRISDWFYRKAGRRHGIMPAYLLGVAFSFTFCPTLFWLFFGLTLPIAVASPGGVLFPGVFAIGTMLPVLLIALFTFRSFQASSLVAKLKSANVWLQRIAGVVFVLIGIHEIILYWLI